MSELKVNGKVLSVLQKETGVSKNGNSWEKQDFVVDLGGKYPKNVCFTLFGQNCDLINGAQKGDDVDVTFNLESKEFNGRWFTNVTAYGVTFNRKIDHPEPVVEEEGGEDLPF